MYTLTTRDLKKKHLIISYRVKIKESLTRQVDT